MSRTRSAFATPTWPPSLQKPTVQGTAGFRDFRIARKVAHRWSKTKECRDELRVTERSEALQASRIPSPQDVALRGVMQALVPTCSQTLWWR